VLGVCPDRLVTRLARKSSEGGVGAVGVVGVEPRRRSRLVRVASSSGKASVNRLAAW
jgi:hypothetical protein